MHPTNAITSGNVFIGESLGDHVWIEAVLDGDPYRATDANPFAFDIIKTPIELKLIINSTALLVQIIEGLLSCPQHGNDAIIDFESRALNGFVLLKHRSVLEQKLRDLQSVGPVMKEEFCELSLLVDGVLNDGDIFESFGHIRLVEQGWLGQDQWKNFLGARIDKDIDTLEQYDDTMEQQDISSTPTFDVFVPMCKDFCNSMEVVDEAILSKMDSSQWTTRIDYNQVHYSRLVSAIQNRDCDQVRFLLQNGLFPRQPPPDSCIVPEMVEYPCSFNGFLEAVRLGHRGVVEVFFEEDVIGTNSPEKALVIAAKMGDQSMLGLLLSHKADYGTAELMLRMEQSNGSRAFALRHLRIAVSRYCQQHSSATRKEAIRLRVLFWREHNRMMVLSKLIVYPPSIHFQRNKFTRGWNFEFETESRKAWNTSMRVLRGLFHGALPRSVNETLLFLALVKNMFSIVYDNEKEREGLYCFERDLERWQLLFNTGDSLLDFHGAIYATWGIDFWPFEQFRNAPLAYASIFNDDKLFRARAELLESFQTLAFSFFDQMNQAKAHQINDVAHLGLLSAQARWRERLRETETPPFSSAAESHKDDTCCRPIRPDKEPLNAADNPLIPPLQANESTPVTRAQLILVVLMAGAIFAAVIAFLLCKCSSSTLLIHTGADAIFPK